MASLPGDFPPWQTVYTYFRTWRKDWIWLNIYDSLQDWTRINIERHPISGFHPRNSSNVIGSAKG